MTTSVLYNGVLIRNCTTRELDQELFYDASDTDLIAARYKLGFEGYIHAQAAATLGHGIQALDAPTSDGNTHVQFDRVSTLLEVPRRPFTMSWGGNPVLAVTPAIAGQPVTANTDVNNGPKPRGLAVLNVTPKAIKVRWSVEVMISFCPGTLGNRLPPHKVINNRWSISESRDADFFTTRRISGTIRFAEGLTPKHGYLGFVVPGLEKGFRRESIEYEAEASGLEARYHVIDRQVHHAAPWPATKMEVTHTNSTHDGLTWLDECSVTLHGPPNADRRLLLSRLIQIIDQRTNALATLSDENRQYIIENVVITEQFGETNTVHGTLAVRQMGNGARIVMGNLLEEKLGKPIENLPSVEGEPAAYDRTISRTPALHGYDPHGDERSPAFLFLLNCFHQDPCSPAKAIFGVSQSGQDEPADQQPAPNPYPIQVPAGSLPTGDLSKYSQQHFQATYLSARMANRYAGQRLRVLLPLATASGNGATAKLADLAAGTGHRVVWYEAERVGDWPQIASLPDTYSKDGLTGYLLEYWIQPQPPALSADGRKKIYRVLFKAVYGLDRIPTTQKLFAGLLPHMNLQTGDVTFDQAQYQTNNIGP